MVHAPDDRPNAVHWPPIIYGAALLVAWMLESVAPLPALPESLLTRWFGGLVFLCGIGIALKALSDLRAHGTTFDPTGRAAALATTGIYAYSRNPMYLAALVVFLGLALALRSTWLFVAIPAVAIALQKLAIEREEAYLQRRFGLHYLRYTDHVRRWI